MPEHVHLMIGEPEKGTPSKVLQVLKQEVSRMLRDTEDDNSPAFWQRRFYDFNVWGEKKLNQKLEYMHRNPVARELVKHPISSGFVSTNPETRKPKGAAPHIHWSAIPIEHATHPSPRFILCPHPPRRSQEEEEPTLYEKQKA